MSSPKTLSSGGTARSTKALAVAAIAVVAALPYFSQHGPPPLTPEWLPPSLIHTGIVTTVSYLDRWVNFLTPPNLAAFRSIMSMVHTAALHAVVKLKIADILENYPMSSVEIAHNISRCMDEGPTSAGSCSRVGTRITRLLRAVSAYGFFRETPPGSEMWQHTAQSLFLSSATSGTLRDVVLNFGDVQYKMMSELHVTVLTGQSSFSRVHGEEFWAWYGAHPDHHAVFDATMEQLGKLGGADAAVAYDVPWSKAHITHVVDVGGGYGHQAAWIAKANSGINATILDLESVIGRARAAWHASSLPSSPYHALSARVSFRAGDMFAHSTIPGPQMEARERARVQGRVACDSEVSATYAYTLRDILHDWPDEDSVRILASLAANMRGRARERVCYAPNGEVVSPDDHSQASQHIHSDRVYIIGRLIEPGTSFIQSLGSFDADTVMLAAFGTTAGERTTEQYGKLIEAAGLRLLTVHRTRGHYTVVEAALSLEAE